jgi:hypothetical protein
MSDEEAEALAALIIVKGKQYSVRIDNPWEAFHFGLTIAAQIVRKHHEQQRPQPQTPADGSSEAES